MTALEVVTSPQKEIGIRGVRNPKNQKGVKIKHKDNKP